MKNRQVMAEMILAMILLSEQTMGKIFGSLSRSLLGPWRGAGAEHGGKRKWRAGAGAR